MDLGMQSFNWLGFVLRLNAIGSEETSKVRQARFTTLLIKLLFGLEYVLSRVVE